MRKIKLQKLQPSNRSVFQLGVRVQQRPKQNDSYQQVVQLHSRSDINLNKIQKMKPRICSN